MRALVVGGLGYLGQRLCEAIGKRDRNSVVDILDYNLFNTEYNGYNVIQKNILDCDVGDFVDYDHIIWCCDVDIPEFCSKEYYDRMFAKYSDILNSFEKTVVRIIDANAQYSEDNEYKEYINNVEKVSHNHNALIYYVGTLFGVSPRMRFDTLINDIVFRGSAQGYFDIGDRFMEPIKFSEVGVRAEEIIGSVINDDEEEEKSTIYIGVIASYCVSMLKQMHSIEIKFNADAIKKYAFAYCCFYQRDMKRIDEFLGEFSFAMKGNAIEIEDIFNVKYRNDKVFEVLSNLPNIGKI